MEAQSLKSWVKRLPETERGTYERLGYHTYQAMGSRPALLIIDCTYGFTGSSPMTLDQATQEYRTSCGEAAWEAMPAIRQAAERFRELQLPIVYTFMDLEQGIYAGTATKPKSVSYEVQDDFNQFAECIRPMDQEWVMPKTKASAFFHTPLLSYLLKQKVDSLVLCGGSTSGCVRATAVDGFSYGFPTFVMEDGCFDRSRFAHENNLFDLDAKYALVQTWEELKPSFS
ncbi:isochorismatase family protein [Paenibacillus alginolyticus]|uniref:Isochorismatase family protein n=1 Tax=Paenibacillus alginolyticus TaxID=59839 RepID=A0ABT4GGY5_9BACL|nr:isochorismatase family protein [Paenibacillus alginolyticus]MCY9666764.1 isochorismatase family protein [Paenibacillus alginolyticus]MCY9695450.1 isochorismatase family protein [Paenibacillus alginolyticus]MEC0146311.1 isochorismatase family protein [Paenibacillus alginolyticus]